MHRPVDHGLVVEHLKTKMELEKNVKRKFESLPLLRRKIKLVLPVRPESFQTTLRLQKRI